MSFGQALTSDAVRRRGGRIRNSCCMEQQIKELSFAKPVLRKTGGDRGARSGSNTLFTTGTRRTCQPLAALAVLMGFIVCLRGAAIIDFRNLIEGVLDAPVYEVDGVTKLQGSQFWANVVVAPRRDGPLTPVGFASPFQTGANAGYWLPQEVTIPGVAAGQQVWVRVVIGETLGGFEQQPQLLWGMSKPFPVVLRDTPTPLMGLESFSLGPQLFGIKRRGGELVISWLNLGNVTYSLESTTDLTTAGIWQEFWRGSSSYPAGNLMSVTNAIVAGEQRFFRLKMWR